MIRYYAYYSCGGYKDMYLGNSSDASEYSYFLPLLPIWRKRQKDEHTQKLKQIEGLQQIEVITKDDNFDFPEQAKNLFSHGGYRIIYRTLSDGSTCLCVRDITNGAKDEESRDIPFNILITASGDDDVKRLDKFAQYLLDNIDDIYKLFSVLFVYDPIVNGIKFNLALINKEIIEKQNTGSDIVHKANKVVFIVVDSLSLCQIAFKELGLIRSQIDLIADFNGQRVGAIAVYNKPVVTDGFSTPEDGETVKDDEENHTEENPNTDIKESKGEDVNNGSIKSDNVSAEKDSIDQKDTDELLEELKSKLRIIEEKLESNSIPIKDIQEIMSKLNIDEKYNRLLQCIENSQNSQSVVRADNEIKHDVITIPKAQLWISGIVLVLGLLLGIIIS